MSYHLEVFKVENSWPIVNFVDHIMDLKYTFKICDKSIFLYSKVFKLLLLPQHQLGFGRLSSLHTEVPLKIPLIKQNSEDLKNGCFLVFNLLAGNVIAMLYLYWNGSTFVPVKICKCFSVGLHLKCKVQTPSRYISNRSINSTSDITNWKIHLYQVDFFFASLLCQEETLIMVIKTMAFFCKYNGKIIDSWSGCSEI